MILGSDSEKIRGHTAIVIRIFDLNLDWLILDTNYVRIRGHTVYYKNLGEKTLRYYIAS